MGRDSMGSYIYFATYVNPEALNLLKEKKEGFNVDFGVNKILDIYIPSLSCELEKIFGGVGLASIPMSTIPSGHKGFMVHKLSNDHRVPYFKTAIRDCVSTIWDKDSYYLFHINKGLTTILKYGKIKPLLIAKPIVNLTAEQHEILPVVSAFDRRIF